MSLRNPFGDRLVSDPSTLRALAHPVRLELLTRLQRHGPATATQLSEHAGASPSVVSWHLRHLASFDLVADAEPDPSRGDRRQRWWKATAPGFAVDVGDDEESQVAGRGLRAELIAAAQAQVDTWLVEAEPDLEPAWAGQAGPSNTLLTLTLAELEDLADAVNDLLAPYVGRRPAPEGARTVRMQRYYLPDPPAQPGGQAGGGTALDDDAR